MPNSFIHVSISCVKASRARFFLCTQMNCCKAPMDINCGTNNAAITLSAFLLIVIENVLLYNLPPSYANLSYRAALYNVLCTALAMLPTYEWQRLTYAAMAPARVRNVSIFVFAQCPGSMHCHRRAASMLALLPRWLATRNKIQHVRNRFPIIRWAFLPS